MNNCSVLGCDRERDSRGMCKMHVTRWCVNPEHLYLGTHQDNMSDRKNRGRTYRAPGEENASAKLSGAQVIEMRQLRAAGISYSEIGRRFGVEKSTARRNCNGECWRNI